MKWFKALLDEPDAVWWIAALVAGCVAALVLVPVVTLLACAE